MQCSEKNGHYFYRKMKLNDGTYQEVGGDYANHVTSFKIEEEAKKIYK